MGTKTEKKFDAVEMMRHIRSELDRELQSMDAEQRQEYFKKQKEDFDEWKKSKNIRNLQN